MLTFLIVIFGGSLALEIFGPDDLLTNLSAGETLGLGYRLVTQACLLLPMLIGGRYGPAAGVGVGLATSAAVIGIMYALGTTPEKIFASYPLTLAALPVAGLICGEIHGFFSRKLGSLAERCSFLKPDFSKLPSSPIPGCSVGQLVIAKHSLLL